LSAYELAEEMRAFARLYDFFSYTDLLRQRKHTGEPSYIVMGFNKFSGFYGENEIERIVSPFEFPPGHRPIECINITHNSPGVQELVGYGAAVRGVFDLLRDVIFLRRGKEIHELEVLERKERIKFAAVSCLERQAAILKDAGIPLETVQQVLLAACKDVALLDAIAGERGITQIDMLDNAGVPVDASHRGDR
jgi:hypothetical protein